MFTFLSIMSIPETHYRFAQTNQVNKQRRKKQKKSGADG